MCQPVGPQEIAEILGVTRARVYQLRARPDFPPVRWDLATGPLWDAEDIRAFAQIPRPSGRPSAQVSEEKVPQLR